MKRNWIFTFNSFDVVTKRSNKKMLSLATDTDSKLAAGVSDPEIQVLYDDFHPLYDAYRLICMNYGVATGNHKGETLNLVTLMDDDLPLQIRIWEGKVRAVYPEDSPQERAIFPNKRTPFLKGTYEQRISAVGSLATKLATDPAFAVLAPQVQSYYNVLLAARDTQQQKEGLAETLSSQREEQRKIVAVGMYVVLGNLMAKFANDTTQIDNYFNLSLIRHSSEEQIPATTIIVHGKVTADGVPLQNALVTIGRPGLPPTNDAYTDADGDYEFRQDELDPSNEGPVQLNVTAPNYQPYSTIFEVELGNEYVKDVALTAAMLRAA